MFNEIIAFYSKTPPNKWILKNYNITYFEENRTCWDDLKVYIEIKNNIIKDWSFEWETAIITTACASIFWESIIWKEIKEIFLLDYKYIKDLIKQEISDRRKKAAVLWLLTTKNAIHKYLKDWLLDDFDSLSV